MDDDLGFKKIDVTQVNQDIQGTSGKIEMKKISTHKNFKRFLRSRNFKIIAVVLVVLVILVAYIAIRMFSIVATGKKTYAQAKLAAAAIKQQNIIDAKDQLVKTQTDIHALQSSIASIAFVGYIPLFGGYYNDMKHFVNAGGDGVNAAIIASDAIIPYADVLGLKGGHSFSGGSAEDRIRLAVNTLGKVVPKIDEIESQIRAAKTEVDPVDINRYPNFWIFKKIRNQIQTARTLVEDSAQVVAQGKPLIKSLPDLLGQTDEKKYLILFQNDKELRPTGGFITFYSIFRINQGIIHVDTSGDIYKLDNSISYHPAAPEIIARYLPKVGTWNIRDSNLSPDFLVSMNDFNTFYATSSLKEKVNGIIAIDTDVLVHTLDILGGVTVDGTTYTSKTDARCNCPQVVYALESQADQPVNYVKSDRKAVVGDLLFAILQTALKSSPKQYWGPLIQVGIKDIQEKHILFDIYNQDAQNGIQALNWAGQIKSFTGDYLTINDANFGGAKSNMYVTQSVLVNYDVASGGEITKTLTITYRNPQPYSDCNLEHGGLCLNATLRDFQRIYVPKGSSLVSSKGSEVKVITKDDLGKTTFQSFLTVNPLGKASIIYTYKLPFKVTNGSLPVLIQKQPGTGTIPYEIDVNGHMNQTFNLVSDQEISVKL